MPLIVARQSQPDMALVEQVCAIYLDSFSPSERVDFQDIMAGVVDETRWLFTSVVTVKLVGFAITIPLLGTNIHLLEYMAVARRLRNQGIGSAMLKEVASMLDSVGNVTGLILEVESDTYGTEQERALRKRRIQFYRRNGANLVECIPQFHAPNLANGEGTSDMKLMWLPFNKTKTTLSKSTLANCIRAIYTQSYGVSADDPLIQVSLEELIC